MDKSILRKFATESRKLLMTSVENQLKKYHIDEEFNKVPSGDLVILKNDKYTLPPMTKEESTLRDKLRSRINNITKEQVIEEAAYTWFNRIIAIRYMELHDMLPLTKDNQSLNIRVLSSKDGAHPEILKMNNLTNSALDLNVDLKEYSKLTTENEQFNYILKKVCNKLGKVIPQIFDGYTDYIDVLLPDNLLLNSGFVYKLVNEVPEDCFDTVEVIGWLYQYYNEEEKDRAMSQNRAYKKNEIPFVTQLFTPDWIVKYMVENSLGRYWIERNYSDLETLSKNWKYFIKNNVEKINEKIKPTDITFIDPCSGSGHILVYAFEVFMQIYKSAGYNTKDIPELILKNNLYGLDIDDRAGQLSVLSVLLKAREYDQNIFNKEIIKNLNIIPLQESNGIDTSYFDQDLITTANIDYLVDTFKDAKEIGSLLKVEKRDYSYALEKLGGNILDLNLLEQIKPLIKQANILSNKYTIMVTNPPYMGVTNISDIAKNYINSNYKESKSDLCACFMDLRINDNNGYMALINQHSWMFLVSFEEIRKKLINNWFVNNMIHIGTRGFEDISGEVVQTTAFVVKKNKIDKESIFIDLTKIKNAREKEKYYLEVLENFESCNDIHKVKQISFNKIPGNPLAYWVNSNIMKIFEHELFFEQSISDGKNVTGNNNKYLRNIWEVNKENVNSNYWKKYVKGGEFRKWYGNLEYVIDWRESTRKFYHQNKVARIIPEYLWNKIGITWTLISSSIPGFRYKDSDATFDSGGLTIFLKDESKINYYLGLFNSKVFVEIQKIYNPTMNLLIKDIRNIPIIFDDNQFKKINAIVEENIQISKEDWDSFETSWDFTKHPLLKTMSKASNIKDSISNWNNYTLEQRSQLKNNEEILNKLFIDIYELNNELTPEVEEQYISIRSIDNLRDIKSFISYFVGCLFGRYSLDEDGLVFAGGQFDLSKYKTFKADEDNIIPIMDTEYFKDDIVAKFKEFVKVTFGEQTLDENLDYIADTLGRKGNETSEQAIRRYFVNDFYKDHIQTYQKKPIYWLLDSGKKNGFKALIYMHRYDKDLISRVRLDYIGKIQTIYENRLKEIENDLNSVSNLSTYDVKQLEKEQNTLYEKLEEIKKYYVKLSTIGDKKIEIDLDNGVTENYKLFRYIDPETNEETNILGEDKIIVPKKK